ncbi:hypothetical protein ACFY8K_16940 [Streptomyces misionensis]|uniref:hypothetical protein n=1 Tax=Streptomyces misionensis TaxID=67331 RepID=UPI0036A4FCD6
MHSTPRLAQAITVFHAWMEDSDWWDGNALYLDLDTAKTHAAYDYEGDEYGHPDEDGDDEGANIRPDFTWEQSGCRWHLIDHGKDTGIRVGETTVYRAATPREIQQQDALRAAEEAARATQPHVPLREALEAEAARRFTTA